MSIKDGIKFGIGYALGQAFLVVLAKELEKVCDKALAALKDNETEENE